jgi:hypothetical protein
VSRALDLAAQATWGARPDAKPSHAVERPRLCLVSCKPVVKGALRGFATVELPIDRPALVGTKGPWVGLPTKKPFDRDGGQRTGADGKPAYSPVLEWSSRDLSDRFSAAVVALVRAAHPDALDGGAQ